MHLLKVIVCLYLTDGSSAAIQGQILFIVLECVNAGYIIQNAPIWYYKGECQIGAVIDGE